jgi:hypothetical protein
MSNIWNKAVDHYPKILGLLFLLAALYFFVTAPPKENFSIVNCLSFISCFAVSNLLWFGAIGPDAIATRLRRAARQAKSVPAEKAVHNVPERTFYYCPKFTWKKALMLAVMIPLGLGFIGVGVFVFAYWKNPGEWGFRLTFLALNAVSACIAIYFPLRQLSMYVKVDSRGLQSRGYFRTVMMPWEDIVALVAKKIIVPFIYYAVPVALDAGDEFRVYSQTDVLRFVPRLPQANELRNIISSETGMVWNA